MQEQFEDLIIDNSGKKDKQKALLFKAILFVVIVLIVALAFKIFNASSSTSTLPDEPNIELSSSDAAPSQFQTVPAEVEDFKDDEFASIQERLSAEHNLPISASAPNTIAESLNITPAPIAPAPKVAPAPAPAPAPKVAPAPAPVVAPAPAPKPATVVVPAPKAPKPIERSVFDSLDVAAPAPKPAPKPAAKAPAAADKGVYIQVYAGKKIDPKSHEIKLLDTLNLQYQIISGNGIERVIVGPYSAADKAQALKFVREKVKKDAFFYNKK